MEALLSYIFLSTSSLSVCYLGYLVLQRREMKLKHLRLYLLLSMLLVLVLPFSKVQVQFPAFHEDHGVITAELINASDLFALAQPAPVEANLQPVGVPWSLVFYWLYFAVASFFLIRMLIHLLVLLRLYFTSVKKRQRDVTLLIDSNIKSPFSFFKWIFLSEAYLDKYDIIAHEKIHASQYHSLDILLIELLTAVMWFNPFVWMMRKSVQLVHEYLADEGVLSTGIDRLQYQTLLVNQVAEGNFICLSSGFHHSLIKKRLIMMTKNKPDQDSKLRILTLVPIALLLFVGVAFMNGQNAGKQSSVVQKSETKKDSLYLNSAFGIQQSLDGKVQSFFTRKYYQEIVINEGKFFVQMGDKQIKSEAEYLAIDPKEVQKVNMALRSEKEKLDKYLKGNVQEYLKGDYGLAMIIILKEKK